ncbi:hypothetical protein AgCh_007239 [Apium graveolens]
MKHGTKGFRRESIITSLSGKGYIGLKDDEIKKGRLEPKVQPDKALFLKKARKEKNGEEVGEDLTASERESHQPVKGIICDANDDDECLPIVSHPRPFPPNILISMPKYMPRGTTIETSSKKGEEHFVKRRQHLVGPNNSSLKALEILTGWYIFVQIILSGFGMGGGIHTSKTETSSKIYESYGDSMPRNEEDDAENDRVEEMIQDVEEIVVHQPEVLENLVDDSKNPRYHGCNVQFTRLSTTLKLCKLKVKNGWSDKNFTEMLKLLAEMLSAKNELPTSTYEVKKILCPMGMNVKKIHAYPNYCVPFHKEHEHLHTCPKCGASRYKRDGNNSSINDKRPPVKVLRYLPIVERFRRLFANSNDAKLVRWHVEARKSDGMLRHPADSPQWRTIDGKFPEFGGEFRSLRLGLCADIMNPYRTLSSTHSTWTVLLTIYNLPPWLYMKREKMDDAYSQTYFNLRAMIFCTISDFPGYGNLSGYTIKGAKACPICEDATIDLRLKNCKKMYIWVIARFFHLLTLITKDGMKARLDLQELGVRAELAPQQSERFLCILKAYVRNRHHPEASIVEGYSIEETIEFCTDYLASTDPVGIPRSRHEGRLDGQGTVGHTMITLGAKMLDRAHLFVLQHMTEVNPYLQEHILEIR